MSKADTQDSYRNAGVDRDAGDALVDKIQIMTRRKVSKKIKTQVGGYAALYEWSKTELLAVTTDGVGTKLKLAFELGDHRTIGQDLVAMSVNDLLCVGAMPLLFLDYFATGKLDVAQAAQVLEGIVRACDEAQCLLVGGETAEMPGFYHEGEYDLAGFAVGRVAARRVLPQKSIRPGDILLGFGSSGFHSNGYSLLRQWIAADKDPKAKARELLTPTRLYVQSVGPLLKQGKLKGLAHITGSGFLNLPRMSDKVGYDITLPKATEVPACFEWARRQSITFAELVQTFNMGVGMIAAVSPAHVQHVLRHMHKMKIPAWELGKVIKGKGEVHIRDEFGQHAVIQ